ncbi:unnamed protein product, partial [Ectocarpus sp. 12 AP-2014]
PLRISASSQRGAAHHVLRGGSSDMPSRDEPSEAPDPRQRPFGQPCHRAGFLPRGCQQTISCFFPDSKSGGSFRGRSEGFFEAEACELRGWGW